MKWIPISEFFLEYINITRTHTSLFCLLVELDNSKKDDRGENEEDQDYM